MPGFRLIAGLGNPGPEYARTRHNAGAWLVEDWVQRLSGRWTSETRLHGRLARWQSATLDVRFLLPDTYMNRSGLAVLSAASYFKILPQEILIVHDELDLPAGQIRFKTGGGHGGHNGLKDIIQSLGQQAGFSRLRVGIGRPAQTETPQQTGKAPTDNTRVVDYVLGQPSQAELQSIHHASERCLDHADLLLQGATENFMNLLHRSPSTAS